MLQEEFLMFWLDKMGQLVFVVKGKRKESKTSLGIIDVYQELVLVVKGKRKETQDLSRNYIKKLNGIDLTKMKRELRRLILELLI